MLCSCCKTRPIIRGLKFITCTKCSKETSVNMAYKANICADCSYRLQLCIGCGVELFSSHDPLTHNPIQLNSAANLIIKHVAPHTKTNIKKYQSTKG